ncbi:hypothetical protein [Pseudomonas sp. NPDC007930]|uniref:hypothetical protein n=1 Tax=Pseudomonas sp. NPDC007930 TaxID=3364417 RepID=UPI0036E5DEF6
MRSDDDIYNDIGGVLIEVAPAGACKIIMRVQLSQELDSCEYEYDYIDEQGVVAWFTAGGRANTDILKLLTELCSWYVENKLTGGLPAWSGCEVILDLVKVKISIDFIYS